MNEGVRLKGSLRVYVNDKLVIDDSNLIVNIGKEEIAKLIGSGLGGTSFGYIAIGSGTTAEQETDIQLENEIARMEATVSLATTNTTNDTVVFNASYTATSDVSITEYGIFNDSSGGTMLSRKVQSAINLVAGYTLSIEWKITVQ